MTRGMVVVDGEETVGCDGKDLLAFGGVVAMMRATTAMGGRSVDDLDSWAVLGVRIRV